MKKKNKSVFYLFTCITLFLTFCTGVSSETEGYRLRPDDAIKLSIFSGGETQTEVELTVSSNGVITCPFLGDIKAEGLTIHQLAEKIREPLSKDFFVEPQVFISLRESKSPEWNIYIMGKVKKPGAYEFKEGLTAVEACVLAGGFEKFAAPNRATITRKENGENKLININLNKEDIPLRPGDRINIPESLL
jgi:protein involved in polysaccharide export with SLBB domain